MATTPDHSQQRWDAARPVNEPPVLAFQLRRVRKEQMDLTLEAFAEQLSTVADRVWSPYHLSRVETGRRNPSPELRAAIERLTGASFIHLAVLAFQLRRVRKEQMDLTLEAFAEQLSTVADRVWSPEHLSQVETGKRGPSPELRAAIERLTGASFIQPPQSGAA